MKKRWRIVTRYQTLLGHPRHPMHGDKTPMQLQVTFRTRRKAERYVASMLKGRESVAFLTYSVEPIT